MSALTTINFRFEIPIQSIFNWCFFISFQSTIDLLKAWNVGDDTIFLYAANFEQWKYGQIEIFDIHTYQSSIRIAYDTRSLFRRTNAINHCQ